MDRPFTVVVSGVAPGATVRVEARLEDEQSPPQSWTAVGEYRADAAGSVDTARTAPVSGSYRGAVAGGLACSVLPAPPDQIAGYLERLSKTPGRTSPLLGTKDRFTVNVTATADGRPVGSARITRRYAAPGVTMTAVDEGGVKGVLFQPAVVRGIPVLAVSGSGGGIWREEAALLASHGHPALAIAQFNYPGLPDSLVNLPVETVGQALAWLAQRTHVERVALVAVSRGTEAAQLAAAHFPQHVAALVLFVPAPMIHGGFGTGGGRAEAAWTLGGVPVPFVTLTTMPSREERERMGRSPPGGTERPVFAAEWSKPELYARWGTPLERIDVPILAFGAGRDGWWPSDLGAAMIRQRMEALGKGRLVESHTYPDAGHGISRPGIASEISRFSVHRVSGQWAQSGGIPEATCAAGYDAAARTLRFLARLPTEPPGTAAKP